MNKAMLAWVFLVVAGAGWCQGAPQVTTLKLVIATRQQTALVGEPVYFSAQVTNEGPMTAIVKVNSGDVMGPWLYMDCCKEALVIQTPDGHIHYGAFSVLYAVLKPGETKSTPDANCDGLVLSQPGHYNVWAELESTGVSAEPTVSPNPPRYDYFWKGHAISNACSIDILAPTSVDAAAYQAFNGNPLAHPVDLLKRFPTSTYAGYALAAKVPDYSNPLFHPVPPAEQLLRARDEGRTYVTFPDKGFEQFFQQLDTFMKGGHVPESLRAVLWGFYGDQLVRRGRFIEAEQAFQEATKGAAPAGGKALAYYDRAKDFLAAFEAKK